jgi:hypothetical protein
LFSKPKLDSLVNPNHELVRFSRDFPWVSLKELAPVALQHGFRNSDLRAIFSLVVLSRYSGKDLEQTMLHWPENPYWQYLSGMVEFEWSPPVTRKEIDYVMEIIGEQSRRKVFNAFSRILGSTSDTSPDDEASRPEVRAVMKTVRPHKVAADVARSNNKVVAQSPLEFELHPNSPQMLMPACEYDEDATGFQWYTWSPGMKDSTPVLGANEPELTVAPDPQNPVRSFRCRIFSKRYPDGVMGPWILTKLAVMPRPLSRTEVGIPNNLIRKKLLDYQKDIARARANAAAAPDSLPIGDDKFEVSSTQPEPSSEPYSEKSAPNADTTLAKQTVEHQILTESPVPPPEEPPQDPNEGKTPEQIQAEHEAAQRRLERRMRSPFVPKF